MSTLFPGSKPGSQESTRAANRPDGHGNGQNGGVTAEELFAKTLCLERKRTERSRSRFVLMLLGTGSLLKGGGTENALEKILCALSGSIRETDVMGWYREASVIGVIFTDIGAAEGRTVAGAILAKVNRALCHALSIDQINEITLSFHVFPEDWEKQGPGGPTDSTFYPDLFWTTDPKSSARMVKRAIDVLGSFSALVLLSPLFAAISIAVKLTSKGPVFFRQQRVGHHGKRFTFLKFRSMYFKSDPSIHEDYIKRFISGTVGTQRPEESQASVYKLTADPRVTRVGAFLRKTSLDELPQFFNVLKGEMSLVGPRPPITYEVKRYDIWHKRRLLDVKPGITGLWQIEGRSRIKFDEMVRLDLKYARSWSLWLDVKILLHTPRAVVMGEGAY
ncbi:MAG TPA: sugar transferase [Terriglobia bacterium]|nr:sugar transferase [Terriglobia bacterium]